MRAELKAGNRSVFSRKLQEALEQRLRAGEQSMLFLNRRGYAGLSPAAPAATWSNAPIAMCP